MDKKTQPKYSLSSRDPDQNKRTTQVESERIEKNIPSKRMQEESWGCNTYIRKKIHFKTKPQKGDKKGHYIILKI